MALNSHPHAMTPTFSACGAYRHSLIEVWDATKPILPWVLFNPSKAGREDGWIPGLYESDPTWVRGIGFSKREGYGGQVFANLYDLVATDPSKLRAHPKPMSDGCDGHIVHAALRGIGTVVVAWGGLANRDPRAQYVVAMLRNAGFALVCFGKTQGGEPRHPLYLAADTPLVPYP